MIPSHREGTGTPTWILFQKNFLEANRTIKKSASLADFLMKYKNLVGLPGVAPGSYPPQGQILLLYYSPFYFLLASVLMHLAQAKTRLPEANLTHCKFGFCFLFTVGLYFPRSFFRRQTWIYFFWQMAHCFIIELFNLRLNCLG